MTASKIEWTERSDWNPIRGCTRVSPGCGGPGDFGGCYAETMAGRFSDPEQWGHGYAERTAKGGRWTGKVEVQWDRLTMPIRWRAPALIFASSTSDFFHEKLDRDEVAQIFGVMIAAYHLRGHRFQVLTKRADRMRQFLNDAAFWEIANAEAGAHIMEHVDPLDRRRDDARATFDEYGPENPPPGIWLGVSVEDQPRADQRRADFDATPAAVKFVSYEPALGAVDWTGWGFVDQIISGGESGPKARPTHPDWHRATEAFCFVNNIAYFFKQWGEWLPVYDRDRDDPDWRDCARILRERPKGQWLNLAAGQGFHGDRVVFVDRVGKKSAGRTLDGREHSGVPL